MGLNWAKFRLMQAELRLKWVNLRVIPNNLILIWANLKVKQANLMVICANSRDHTRRVFTCDNLKHRLAAQS